MTEHNHANDVDNPISANILEGDDWRDCEGEGLQCARVTRRERCGNPAVLAFRRGIKRRSWWAYCSDHSFSRVRMDDGIYFVFLAAFPPPEIREALVRMRANEGIARG